MTTARLPRKCARVSADLARELGKTWPPVRHEPGKQERHATRANHFHQTADIIEFPPSALDEQIGAGHL